MYEKDNTNDLLPYRDSESSTSSDSLDLIYDACYNGVYNALNDYNTFGTRSVRSSEVVNASDNDAVEFATTTDSTLYTVTAVNAPTSSAQQAVTYLLEIRNILLIFVLLWLSITLYSKIKNLMINYSTKN